MDKGILILIVDADLTSNGKKVIISSFGNFLNQFGGLDSPIGSSSVSSKTNQQRTSSVESISSSEITLDVKEVPHRCIKKIHKKKRCKTVWIF